MMNYVALLGKDMYSRNEEIDCAIELGHLQWELKQKLGGATRLDYLQWE